MSGSRHSKNNTDGAVFTYHEKKLAGYGTQKVRLGAESLLRFGCCGLCLQRAIKPLAAPSGHIYCKECIYKNLLEQQKKLKIARKRYAAEQAEREARASEARTRAEAESVAAFVASQVPAVRDEDALFTSGVVSASSAGGDDDGAAPSASKEEEEARDKVRESLSRKFVPKTEVWNQEQLSRTSFWTPDHTPEAAAAATAKPDPAPRDPLDPKSFLKLKQLAEVNFRFDGNGRGGGSGATGGAGSSSESGFRTAIICAVSQKPIINQKVVLLKPSGELVLRSVFRDVVKSAMRCPITGKKLRQKDVLELVPGGTAFAGHNKVEASSHRAALI